MLRELVEDVTDLSNAKKESKVKEILNKNRNQINKTLKKMIKLIGKCQLKIQKKSLIKLTKAFIQTAQFRVMKLMRNI